MKLKSKVLKCTECREELVDLLATSPLKSYDAIKTHFAKVHGDEPFNFSERVGSMDIINEPEGSGPGEDM